MNEEINEEGKMNYIRGSEGSRPLDEVYICKTKKGMLFPVY